MSADPNKKSLNDHDLSYAGGKPPGPPQQHKAMVVLRTNKIYYADGVAAALGWRPLVTATRPSVRYSLTLAARHLACENAQPLLGVKGGVGRRRIHTTRLARPTSQPLPFSSSATTHPWSAVDEASDDDFVDVSELARGSIVLPLWEVPGSEGQSWAQFKSFAKPILG